jgi:cytochrome c
MWRKALLLLSALLVLAFAACEKDARSEAVKITGGDPDRGKEAINRYGCATCHTIPGVSEEASVGPPLTGIAKRGYLGGHLENTPANLIRWIKEPQKISPGTAMPDMNVADTDARNIAAYLYTLR